MILLQIYSKQSKFNITRKKDWQELSMIIYYEVYKVVDAEKQPPEWVDYAIEMKPN